jgi:hypothetical protein
MPLNISNGQIAFGFMKGLWLVLGMISVVILHKYILKNQVARRYQLIKLKVSMKALFRRKRYFIVLKTENIGICLK